MALIICLILMSGVFADSSPNDNLIYEYTGEQVSSTPIPTYQPTYATPYQPTYATPYQPTYATPYESPYSSSNSPSTVGTSVPIAITQMPVVSYGSSTPPNYPSSVSPTVLTPYQLYQSRWCAGLLRSPQAIPSDPSLLRNFSEHYVIPEYRSLWYRTCYLPYRGLGVATLWFDRGMSIANTAFRGAIGTADSALGVGTNVLRDVFRDRIRP